MLKSVLGLMAIGCLFVAGNDDLTGIKCVVNGEAGAKKEAAAKYLDGEVYFCCGGCKSKFEAAPEKYTVKANHQLALTGQYVQKKCPISGGELSEGVTAKVGGMEVGFCCNNCQGKVESAEDLAAKADLVFTKEAFAKGFVKKEEEVSLDGVKCMLMPKKDVSKDQFVEYEGGKVYFCCKGCVGKFKGNTEKYTGLANHQLVLTKQFVQTGCPFSGSEVDPEQMVTINGVEVGFCCGNCKGKVEAAEEKDRVEMVFGKDAFKKGFAQKN